MLLSQTFLPKHSIHFPVGFNPDMLHFTKDCETIVTADEGEPYEAKNELIDPEGSVSIIRLDRNNIGASPMVKTLDFTAFNERLVKLLWPC